tara:strand:- start:182 stop:490 length:309 start_codon:yes stop_codon:yes gene_type:complete
MVLKILLSRNKYEGKLKYKLDQSAKKRRLVLDAEIKKKSIIETITIRSAAQKKKGRLNALRIYRKNKVRGSVGFKQCEVLTRDMKYIDKKYLKNSKTNKICG